MKKKLKQEVLNIFLFKKYFNDSFVIFTHTPSKTSCAMQGGAIKWKCGTPKLNRGLVLVSP